MAKFAVFNFSALGRSFFEGGAPTQTRAHRPASQCHRIRLRHLLYPATTCSTPMQGRRLWDSLLLTKPSTRTSWAFRFYGFCRQNTEPTSGLEPLTCSLRVITQALQGCAEACNSRISKRVSFLCLAACCTVLRSRWYQSGIKRSPVIRVKRCRKSMDYASPVPLQTSCGKL
jgi:hypothetical protein